MIYTERPLPQKLLDNLRDKETDHNYRAMIQSIAWSLIETEHIPGVVAVLGTGTGRTSAWIGEILDIIGSKKRLLLFDAFPVAPIHPDETLVDVCVDCNYDTGIADVDNAFDALETKRAREYVPGWFKDTVKTKLPPASFVYVDVPNRSSLLSMLHELYMALADGSVCLFEGYGLGLTACVQRQTDAFLLLRPEKMENTVSGIQGGFVRQVPQWLKDEQAAAAKRVKNKPLPPTEVQ